MNKKVTVILYILILLAIVAMFVGIYYTYNLKTNKKDNTNITTKTINLLIEYENGSKINLNKLEYDKDYNFNFSIINDSKDEIGNYKLVFDIITPLENRINDNFIYSLIGSTTSFDNKNKMIDIRESIVPVSNKELGVGYITPGTTHKYELKLKINKSDKEKDYLKNKIFVGRIKVVSNNE